MECKYASEMIIWKEEKVKRKKMLKWSGIQG